MLKPRVWGSAGGSVPMVRKSGRGWGVLTDVEGAGVGLGEEGGEEEGDGYCDHVGLGKREYTS